MPFIPVLDSSFSIWFKKDSLWQAEDIEAVFDQDPQRVCILQGPVAVKYCTTTQQPIAELLGGIESSLAKKVLDEFYGGDESKIPKIDYLAPAPRSIDTEALLAANHIAHRVEDQADGGAKHIYDINGVLPPTGDWLDALAGPKLNWLQAFLSNLSIVHGDQTLPNPVKRVLAPRHGQRVELSVSKDGQPVSLFRYDVFVALFTDLACFDSHSFASMSLAACSKLSRVGSFSLQLDFFDSINPISVSQHYFGTFIHTHTRTHKTGVFSQHTPLHDTTFTNSSPGLFLR